MGWLALAKKQNEMEAEADSFLKVCSNSQIIVSWGNQLDDKPHYIVEMFCIINFLKYILMILKNTEKRNIREFEEWNFCKICFLCFRHFFFNQVLYIYIYIKYNINYTHIYICRFFFESVQIFTHKKNRLFIISKNNIEVMLILIELIMLLYFSSIPNVILLYNVFFCCTLFLVSCCVYVSMCCMQLAMLFVYVKFVPVCCKLFLVVLV